MKTLGQRPSRIIARICMAVSFAILAALVIFPALGHHALFGGWPTAAAAAVSIAASLAYLRSTRRGTGPLVQHDQADGPACPYENCHHNHPERKSR